MTRSRRGFTLIEVLLAIGISSVVMVTLYMAMSIGLRGRETVNSTLDPVRSANLAVDLARADLESVVPPTQNVLAQAFVGTASAGSTAGTRADWLSFHAVTGGSAWRAAQDQAAGGVGGRSMTTATQKDPLEEGIHHIEIGIRRDVNPPVLVRRITKDLMATSTTEPEEEILCRNVRNFGLRYWDIASGDWVDEWDSEAEGDVAPGAVELTLEIEYRPSSVPGAEPAVYRVVRIVPIPCGKAAADTTGGAE